MGYSKPTVSVMMKQLRESGYITTDPDGYIALSDTGRKIAESIYERHVVIARVLMSIGVSEETAYADACKIEHDISPESFECMKKSYADSLALFEKTGGKTDAFPCRD